MTTNTNRHSNKSGLASKLANGAKNLAKAGKSLVAGAKHLPRAAIVAGALLLPYSAGASKAKADTIQVANVAQRSDIWSSNPFSVNSVDLLFWG